MIQSEQICIGNVKEGYRSTNKVNHIDQTLQLTNQCTGHDYIE